MKNKLIAILIMASCSLQAQSDSTQHRPYIITIDTSKIDWLNEVDTMTWTVDTIELTIEHRDANTVRITNSIPSVMIPYYLATFNEQNDGLVYELNYKMLYSKRKWNYKRSAWGYGIAFIGGAANGLNQTLLHHYPQFEKMHPNANGEYWNPSISWKRKYKDFDGGDLSERFFLSKTALSGFTDAYHLTSQLSTGSIIAATCVITIGERRKWWEYGIDIVGTSIARSMGFHTIYSIIYK